MMKALKYDEYEVGWQGVKYVTLEVCIRISVGSIIRWVCYLFSKFESLILGLNFSAMIHGRVGFACAVFHSVPNGLNREVKSMLPP